MLRSVMTMRTAYEISEHTADLGIRVKGRTVKDLFSRAAGAIAGLTAEPRAGFKSSAATSLMVKLQAANREDLFISWLNEVLSLSAAKGLIFQEIEVCSIDENFVAARLTGAPIGQFQVFREIKAATYHGLTIKRCKGMWQAEVLFDV